MNNLVVRKTSRRDRYFNNTMTILKGIVGAYMFIVGGTLKFVFNHKTEVLCGAVSAWLVQLAM